MLAPVTNNVFFCLLRLFEQSKLPSDRGYSVRTYERLAAADSGSGGWLVAYIKSKYSLHFLSLSQYQEFQDSQNTVDQSTYNPCIR